MEHILFCDIDYTLSDFPHEAGMLALQAYLLWHIPSQPARVSAGFVDETFHLMLDEGRGASPAARERKQLIARAAPAVIPPELNKADVTWSRELWLQIAAQNNGFNLDAEITVGAADAYWNAIGQYAFLYPDVLPLFRWLEKSGWQLVLVTSSDARLTPTDTGHLIYDPEESTIKKRNRLMPEFRKEIVSLIVVGDPVGKPDPEFWERVFHEADYSEHHCLGVMIGDSYKSDIVGLSKWGVVGAVLDRDNLIHDPAQQTPEASAVVRDLSDVPVLLESLET